MAKATGPAYKLKFRRRIANLTDFGKRLALVKSGLPRLVVRKTNKGILVQLFEFSEKGDRVLASVHSRELSKFGWYPKCNSPTAYLSGLLCAKKAKGKANEFQLDLGLATASKGSVVFAAQKGAIDGGLKSGIGEGMAREKAVDGSEISQYAKRLQKEGAAGKLFSEYAKRNIDVFNLPAIFQESKKKIFSG